MSKKSLLTDEIIMTLINSVKCHPCLWNTEDEHYNDRFHILTAWKDISKMLDLPEEVIKTKWKNLRDLFKRELKKHRVRSINDYYGKWRHFHVMWFLHKPGHQVYPDDNEEAEELSPLDDEPSVPNDDNFVKYEPNDGEVQIYLDDPIDTQPEKRRRYNDDDYDIMYLKSLTPYFRQLEPMRKLVVRSKIQDMLMNEIAAQNAPNRPVFKNS